MPSESIASPKNKNITPMIIAIQMGILGAIAIDLIGLHVPMIRELTGIIYLTFAPGILIIKILKFDNLTKWQTIIFAISLSMSSLMFCGLFINTIYPLIGISKPLSLMPLIVTLSLFVLILTILYNNTTNRSWPNRSANKTIIKMNPCLFLALIPILSILAARVVSTYEVNSLLLIVIILISLVPIIIAFSEFIPENLYVISLFLVSAALLLHVSMVSDYPFRMGVDGEYYYLNQVIQNGNWDNNLPGFANSALSNVFLIPEYSIILGISPIWLLKFIFPIIFSLIPIITYHIYNKQFSSIHSFISAFLLISFYYFYQELPLLRRQAVAIIFFLLIFFVMLEDKFNNFQKSILATIFGLSLIVSHYSMAYIFIIVILIYAVINFFIEYSISKLMFLNYIKIPLIYRNRSNIFPSRNFIIFFIITSIAWYMFISSGSSLTSVIRLGNFAISGFFESFGVNTRSPYIASAFGSGFMAGDILNKIYRILSYNVELFIVVGYFALIGSNTIIKKDYRILITSFFLLLFAFIIIPYLSLSINIDRLFFIALMFISPLCLLGVKSIFNYILIKANILFSCFPSLTKINQSNVYKFFFIFIVLIPYFLFNSGFVFAALGFNQQDILSGSHRIPISPAISFGATDSGYYNSREFMLASRLPKILSDDAIIYGDAITSIDLINAWHPAEYFPNNLTKFSKNSYLFFRTWDINKKEIYTNILDSIRLQAGYISFKSLGGSISLDLFGKRTRIYDSGGSILLGKN
jgi:uncharacterized membrane protein